MSRPIARRSFLSTAAAAGVSAGVFSETAARASTSANEQISVGVMGLSRGRDLGVNFGKQTNTQIKYVCDIDENRVRSGAEHIARSTNSKPQTLLEFRKMLDDPELDAVVVAAPNHWHAPATILACAAGKHVYVEKPCSHNPHEGELMVQSARKHQRAVQMGSQRRSGPGTIQAIQRLRDGAIGRPYLARTWYNNARGSIGKGKMSDPPAHLNYDLWQGPAPRVPYIDNRLHYNWHWFWHWGNGELGNNGVHTIDLCRWGLDVEFPTRVTSSGGRYHFEDDQETPDTHTVCFEFEGKRQITWQGLSCNRHGSGFVTFYGDAGSLELDSDGTHRLFDKRDKLVKEFASPSLGHVEHIENFLNAIRNQRPLELNAEIEIGHRSTLLCHLGNIAHRVGVSLNCDPEQGGRIVENDAAMTLWQRQYEPGWEPQV